MMTREDIHKLARAASCTCEKLGDLIINTGGTNTALETTNQLLTSIDAELARLTWLKFAGHSVDYTYDGNGNVTLAEYKSGVTVIWTETYTYDVNNNVTNITTT